MYDALVVGARCGGSPTAMLLARKGYRVLLVDRDTFPRDTISSHNIWPPGVECLKRWSLLDKVQDSGCPPIARVTFDVGKFALQGSPPASAGPTANYAPRRTVLDKILVDAAASAGAEVREAFSVQEILSDGDRITGIRGRSKNGPTVNEKARIVIGADGMHSLVARSVKAPEYNAKPPLTLQYYSFWSGVARDGIQFYSRQHRVIGVIPTNQGLANVIIVWPTREFHSFRSDIEGNYLKTIDLAPELAERVRNGRREERFYGMADIPNFFRRPYGGGWALVGDAGYHKDPITAQGITDAFRDAELLAGAIDDGFSGRRPLEEALAGYERARNESVADIYEFTYGLASLETPPEMQDLFQALRGNQREIDRFMGVFGGTVHVTDFFAPENVGRIVAGAAGGV